MPSSLFQNQRLNPQIKSVMENINSLQMQTVMQMLKGTSPKQLVEGICKQRGIDVNDFINQIKNS